MKPYEERLADAQGEYARGLRNVKNDPTPEGQKFPVGAFVKVAKDLGPTMSHFTNDVYAKIEYTYAHAYGGSNIDSYSLILQYDEGNWSSSAWYHEHQLTLVTDKKILKKLEKDFKSGS